ncbi:MAG: UDP-N-acetylglucosamine 1-carboxyvinyltransferase [Actinobacteria bacterium]|uniref:UDP-N-acetylglucosamine 1-carboxyvinyltransferase n=1 Tax=freshwater metagenome TaxID=449393 RepID=A0A6J7EP47_9ZZZZ|nr:UDP-N-acetylglucosamine 1-carboxyvinyltransferase [Actinomycetota bacterium]MSY13819.1 UDP-N-acetylglucosamine 1-carboxyvinyltransferase [Actinomycetota bacterium]MSZ03709.1 UDP-N-acetylglucosamine 1-carboxyvinyltransferase [Actinomycetota bacterium]MTB05819.1 UDP-N-acetylglucosamine 1-carboxyvinyltransferase [Actinomycetota bacterium]
MSRSPGYIVARRSGPLEGEVTVPGAKNSVLKLMAATLLTNGRYEISNVPGIDDVATMGELLAALGVTSYLDPARPGVLVMENSGSITPEAPYELVERIRASIVVLGPLLARCGVARVSMPGGDDFGKRPIDMHLKGLEALGATFELRRGYIEARTEGLHGADITLDFPSVGATENILMAAVVAKGATVIDNAAREPEVADLCNFLNSMGASIEGVGSPTLYVHGVPQGDLSAANHAVVADRVQAATYLAAVAVCQGEVVVRGARAEHMEMYLRRLREMGVQATPQQDGILVYADSRRLRSLDVQTLPYPGFATDYKPLMVTLLTVADGVGIVTENLYPGRFRYVEELQRLGADIRTDGHHAVVRGVTALEGAPVRAPDIRAGAALVVAGLAAVGETLISDVHHVDRGYDDLVGRLASLGADIERIR